MMVSSAIAAAQDHRHQSLGIVDFPVSCAKRSQAQFNHAVALLHHMTYPQARREFEQIAAADSPCAMAHWGIAMTLFQPLWPTRPNAQALQRGWDEVQRAQALRPATERERLFVAATEAFYLDPSSGDYWLRIRRFEEAMARLHRAFPSDVEGDAFYALSILATSPPTSTSTAHADSAAELLRVVYARNPKHPGAMHYLVHADDVPGRERKFPEVTARYSTEAPRNPHALRMPTHIYTRLGDWNAVIKGNLQAADAALETPAGEHGEFVWDEFPHAIEYLVYAYLQKGEDDSASAQIQRLRATANIEPTFKTAFHLASTRARYVLERHAWSEAERIQPREPSTIDWDRFAWPEAISLFARGLGAAHGGRGVTGDSIVRQLGVLEGRMRASGEELFARNIRVMQLELQAWLAHVAKQGDSSRVLMQAAVQLEESTPKHAVTPGPTIPAAELLGDLLMEDDHPREALAAYTRALELYPNRFNALLGAARAARGAGENAAARAHYSVLIGIAAGGQRTSEIKEARDYLAAAR